MLSKYLVAQVPLAHIGSAVVWVFWKAGCIQSQWYVNSANAEARHNGWAVGLAYWLSYNNSI